MPLMHWRDFAALQVDDLVYCHALDRPYWLWEAVVVSVEPPAVSVYLPRFDALVTPRLERLHHVRASDATCQYCRAVAGEWPVCAPNPPRPNPGQQPMPGGGYPSGGRMH
jgi:hypothetical protein